MVLSHLHMLAHLLCHAGEILSGWKPKLKKHSRSLIEFMVKARRQFKERRCVSLQAWIVSRCCSFIRVVFKLEQYCEVWIHFAWLITIFLYGENWLYYLSLCNSFLGQWIQVFYLGKTWALVLIIVCLVVWDPDTRFYSLIVNPIKLICMLCYPFPCFWNDICLIGLSST